MSIKKIVSKLDKKIVFFQMGCISKWVFFTQKFWLAVTNTSKIGQKILSFKVVAFSKSKEKKSIWRCVKMTFFLFKMCWLVHHEGRHKYLQKWRIKMMAICLLTLSIFTVQLFLKLQWHVIGSNFFVSNKECMSLSTKKN